MTGLSIVIPAYNERGKIGRDVEAAARFLRASNIDGEIIVVDDGSTDGTADAAEALRSQAPLRVLTGEPNRGKGRAVARGVMEARGATIMFADAGLCIPYEIASIGLKMLELDMCDLAHGSRRMRGSVVRAQPLYRRAGARAYKAVLHMFMGLPFSVSDTQCGFKIYRRDVARDLYAALLTDGFMFDVEIVLRALQRGYRLLEFPVLWSNDAETSYDPVWGTVRNARELAAIRWALARQGSRR